MSLRGTFPAKGPEWIPCRHTSPWLPERYRSQFAEARARTAHWKNAGDEYTLAEFLARSSRRFRKDRERKRSRI
jgi:hypothetical protein